MNATFTAPADPHPDPDPDPDPNPTDPDPTDPDPDPTDPDPDPTDPDPTDPDPDPDPDPVDTTLPEVPGTEERKLETESPATVIESLLDVPVDDGMLQIFTRRVIIRDTTATTINFTRLHAIVEELYIYLPQCTALPPQFLNGNYTLDILYIDTPQLVSLGAGSISAMIGLRVFALLAPLLHVGSSTNNFTDVRSVEMALLVSVVEETGYTGCWCSELWTNVNQVAYGSIVIQNEIRIQNYNGQTNDFPSQIVQYNTIRIVNDAPPTDATFLFQSYFRAETPGSQFVTFWTGAANPLTYASAGAINGDLLLESSDPNIAFEMNGRYPNMRIGGSPLTSDIRWIQYWPKMIMYRSDRGGGGITLGNMCLHAPQLREFHNIGSANVLNSNRLKLRMPELRLLGNNFINGTDIFPAGHALIQMPRLRQMYSQNFHNYSAVELDVDFPELHVCSASCFNNIISDRITIRAAKLYRTMGACFTNFTAYDLQRIERVTIYLPNLSYADSLFMNNITCDELNFYAPYLLTIGFGFFRHLTVRNYKNTVFKLVGSQTFGSNVFEGFNGNITLKLLGYNPSIQPSSFMQNANITNLEYYTGITTGPTQLSQMFINPTVLGYLKVDSSIMHELGEYYKPDIIEGIEGFKLLFAKNAGFVSGIYAVFDTPGDVDSFENASVTVLFIRGNLMISGEYTFRGQAGEYSIYIRNDATYTTLAEFATNAKLQIHVGGLRYGSALDFVVVIDDVLPNDLLVNASTKLYLLNMTEFVVPSGIFMLHAQKLTTLLAPGVIPIRAYAPLLQ